MYNNRMRNIEIPENLFSNLGEMKVKRNNLKDVYKDVYKEESNNIVKNYEEENDIKLTNYSKYSEYRKRITKMYEDIKSIKPIDNEIDNVLYFNNYIEKGIVIKPKVSSMKQFWTEYRLINNEKSTLHRPNEKTITSIDNFDELFEALSFRVTEINKYIDELREKKKSIEETKDKLEEDKKQLKEEKQGFLSYKKQEEKKIKEEKENLKINFERLQTIIDDLDKKLESVDKFDN